MAATHPNSGFKTALPFTGGWEYAKSTTAGLHLRPPPLLSYHKITQALFALANLNCDTGGQEFIVRPKWTCNDQN